MNKFSIVLIGCSLAISQLVSSAQAQCENLPSSESDVLLSLRSAVNENNLLQVNFDEGVFCLVARDAVDLEQLASSAVHVNPDLDEIAVQSAVDGFETWLRIDSKYEDALVLDRKTSEDLGLTDAEFLGDNSLLEASNFFIEYVASLEIGDYQLRDIEANIPHLKVPYDQYQGRGPKPALSDPEAEHLTVGTIGEAVLEDLIITLDFTNNRIYMTAAR
ncbi:MAG: hypothetical protein WDZ52_07640 [Pseudohongiellaceae bacterium]